MKNKRQKRTALHVDRGALRQSSFAREKTVFRATEKKQVEQLSRTTTPREERKKDIHLIKKRLADSSSGDPSRSFLPFQLPMDRERETDRVLLFFFFWLGICSPCPSSAQHSTRLSSVGYSTAGQYSAPLKEQVDVSLADRRSSRKAQTRSSEALALVSVHVVSDDREKRLPSESLWWKAKRSATRDRKEERSRTQTALPLHSPALF